MKTTTLLVRQDQLGTTRIATRDDTPLAEGQVRVERARELLQQTRSV